MKEEVGKPLKEVRAYICVSVRPKNKLPEVADVIKRIKEVRDMYTVTGEYDYLLHIIVDEVRRLGDIVNRIISTNYIDNIYTMLIVNVIKEEKGRKSKG